MNQLSLIADLLAQIDELQSIIEMQTTQLNAKYGCESCPGMPTLTNPDVAKKAFTVAVYDIPSSEGDEIDQKN